MAGSATASRLDENCYAFKVWRRLKNVRTFNTLEDLDKIFKQFQLYNIISRDMFAVFFCYNLRKCGFRGTDTWSHIYYGTSNILLVRAK